MAYRQSKAPFCATTPEAHPLERPRNRERALKNYDAAILLEPENGEAYYNRGLALEAMGERDRAIDDFTTALELLPNRLVIRTKLKSLGQ